MSRAQETPYHLKIDPDFYRKNFGFDIMGLKGYTVGMDQKRHERVLKKRLTELIQNTRLSDDDVINTFDNAQYSNNPNRDLRPEDHAGNDSKLVYEACNYNRPKVLDWLLKRKGANPTLPGYTLRSNIFDAFANPKIMKEGTQEQKEIGKILLDWLESHPDYSDEYYLALGKIVHGIITGMNNGDTTDGELGRRILDAYYNESEETSLGNIRKSANKTRRNPERREGGRRRNKRTLRKRK